MEVLRELSQIENKIKEIFDVSFSFEDFISKFIPLEDIKNTKIKDSSNKSEILCEVSDLILQLRNYMFALSNIIRMMLFCGLEEETYIFVKRLFVGQIGQIKYTSTKTDYSFDERFFDKFVSIVKNCDVERELYLPFVLKAFESDKSDILFVWKRPAIEFMQRFFNENEKWTFDYLKNHEDQKYGILAMITDFNTPRGIKLLFDDFMTENANENKIAHILKKYRRETFFELDKRIVDANENKEKLLEILFMFGKDTESITRLKEIYEHETDENLKNMIAEKLDIIEDAVNKSEKQFAYLAKRKVKEPQERTLGLVFDKCNLKFKDGTNADNIVYTYIINLFKDENNLFKLKNLEYLLNIFNPESLFNFAQEVFENLKKKDDIKCAKWAIRMASLLCDENQAKALGIFALSLLGENRIKEAKYLIECLCYCGKKEILEIFASPFINKIEEEDFKDKTLDILLKKSEMNKDELADYLVCGKVDSITFEEQKLRLYDDFINDRRYSFEYFNKISKIEPFKTLFERVVFGEYRFGRLNNAFYMKNGEKKYLVELSKENILITEDENRKSEFNIGIVHSLDIDERFGALKNLPFEPLFDQFKYGKYDIKTFNQQISEVNVFSGMFITVAPYVEKMKECGFNKNVENGNQTFESLVNINKNLDLACFVHLDKPVLKDQIYSVLDSITFYKLSDLIENNGMYSYKLGDMLSVGSLPARYFDYCLSCVISCAK